ncbi:hypothetical protein GGI10_002557 [Coemansia sp. RSA 2530]|nr:hypothetical protein GGI10_002557 [Coemansia sp. RSA 2530]
MTTRISKIVFGIQEAGDAHFIPGLQATEACGPLYAPDRWTRTIRRQLRGLRLAQGQKASVIVGSRQVHLSVDLLFEESTCISDKPKQAGAVDDETVFEIQRRSQTARQQQCLPGYNSDSEGLSSEIAGYFARRACFRHLNVKPVQTVYVCGAPGVGKSTVINHALGRAGYPAVYGDVRAMVASASGTEMASEYFAMTLDDLVARARALTPSVILVDRVDVLGDAALLSEHEDSTKLATVFAKFIDSIPQGVFLVLESSLELGELPMAVKRCESLQHCQAIGIPTAPRREQMVKAVLGELVAEIPSNAGVHQKELDGLCRRVAAATPGYVARDIVRLCRQALLRMLRGRNQSVDLVGSLAESMTLLSLTGQSALTPSMPATMTVPAWQWFGSALQIVRPSQQLEFESARPMKRWADIGGSDLFSKYLGETEARLRRLFHAARAAAPCIVFMDEIDSIAAKREWSSVESGGPSLRVLSTLLNEMDGVHETSGVVTVGCTNQVNKIDDAILRPGRFDQLVEVHLPTAADRSGILQVLSSRSKVADDVSIDDLVKQTDGLSGAGLEQLFREAGMSAMRTRRPALELGVPDFTSALGRVRKQQSN